MYKILMLGPQGSGKGTQAKILAEKLKIPHLSMGALLREAALRDDERAALIRPLVAAGELVPFGVGLSVLVDRLAEGDAVNGYLLDGFPRNEGQFSHYDAYDQPTHVIVLQVPRDVSLERLLLRAKTEGRADDTADIIDKRLRLYEEQTEPMIGHYRERGLVYVVDATGDIEQVAERVAAIFGIAEG